MERIRRLAVFTAAYPGVERFLADWHRSLAAQTDRGFDLWIALDGVSKGAVGAALGHDPGATWVQARPGDTPAQVRQRGLAALAPHCDAVVLVDADDLLHPTRVAAARLGLERADLSVCALRLVDERGRDLGATMGIPAGTDPDATMPLTNAFGLSNVAYRAGLLRRCLPIPAGAWAVDWFLATRAWLQGAVVEADPVARMDYRQHGANMATVLPPFDDARVRIDADRVADHLALVLAAPGHDARPERLARLAAAAAEIDAFRRRVTAVPERLTAYTRRLGEATRTPLWWAHVAHPALCDMWRDADG